MSTANDVTQKKEKPRSKDETTSYRMARLRFQLTQFRKQWRIYYRSWYGKIGFYILVAFIIITVLTPVLELHNPNNFFAPQEDAFVASNELNAHFVTNPNWNVSLYPPAASPLSTSGSYVVYAGTPDGHVYAIGLGGAGGPALGSTLPILNVTLGQGQTMFSPLVFPLSNYNRFVASGFRSISYDNYLATVTSNGTIHISRINWQGNDIPGTGLPFLTHNVTYYANTTVVLPPVSSSQATTYGLPPWVPFNSAQIVPLGFSNGQIFLITQSNGSYYLRAFSDYPLAPSWTQRLNGSALPSIPNMMGNYYENPDQASLLIEQGSNVTSYSPVNGSMKWQVNLQTTLNTNVGVYIPYGYQVGYNPFNKVYVSSGDSFYMVSASNGGYSKVRNFTESITGLSSSQATAVPNPQYFAVQTVNYLYLLNGLANYSQISNPFSLPSKTLGTHSFSPIYNGNTHDFISGTDLGNFVSVTPNSKTTGKPAVIWHVDYSSISKGAQVSPPILISNSLTGAQAFAFTSGDGSVLVYSTAGKVINPFPPTLHAPSGNIYLLGTNTNGQDVWSQLIAGFAPDWEVGAGVAIVTIIISVVVAMIVGYLGGFIGSLFESVSLTIFLIPFIPLLIVVTEILSPSLEGAIFVLAAVGWPFVTFTLIGLVRSIKSHAFIEAAKVSGARTPQILRRHMLSNMTPLLAYLTSVQIGGSVAAISTLQFLGVVSITTVTWGAMLSPVLNNFYLAAIAPWWILPPTIVLTTFIFAFVFVSRGLDEVVNPRLRRR